MTELIQLYLTWCGIIAAPFTWGGKAFKPDFKLQLLNYLLPETRTSAIRAKGVFVSAFDSLYKTRIFQIGNRTLIIPNPLIAGLASIIFGVLLGITWSIVVPPDVQLRFLPDKGEEIWPHLSSLVVYMGPFSWLEIDTIIVTFLLFNLPMDYISLLQTRWIIRRIDARRAKSVLSWLLVDAVLTLAIVIFFFGAVTIIYFFIGAGGPYVSTWSEYTGKAVRYFMDGLFFWGDNTSLLYSIGGVYMYSTFLTSFALWVLSVGVVLVRLDTVRVAIGQFARINLTIEQKPMICLSGITILFFSVLFWGWNLVSILLRSI